MRPFRTSIPLALAGLLALPACATFTENSTAATVNGRDIPRDRLEAFIDEFAANEQLELADGVVAAEDARNVLSGMIKSDAYQDYLKTIGKPLTKQQRDEMRDEIAGQNVGELSPGLEDLIIGLNAATKAITELDMPPSGEIEKLYNDRPSLTGALCASHVVVEKKKTAEKVLSKLSQGAKFADLAKKYSTEPAAKTSGGALQGQTEDGDPTPCLSILEYQQNFDPAFVRGAIDARAGVPYGPVKSSFGWHVILLAPWSDVESAALEVINANPGANLATGWLAHAKVSVDPAYGRWEPATGMVAAS